MLHSGEIANVYGMHESILSQRRLATDEWKALSIIYVHNSSVNVFKNWIEKYLVKVSYN